ncbi:MAG: hypothetical protein ACPIOQ_34095, partial [Promethearchaeia archaeon]
MTHSSWQIPAPDPAFPPPLSHRCRLSPSKDRGKQRLISLVNHPQARATVFRFRTESSWKVDVRSGSCRGVTLRDGAMAAQRQTGGLRDSDEWEVE